MIKIPNGTGILLVCDQVSKKVTHLVHLITIVLDKLHYKKMPYLWEKMIKGALRALIFYFKYI